MKNIKENISTVSLISSMIFAILFFSAENLYSQGNDPLRIYLNVDCYQKGQVKELKATIRARIGENRKILPVPGIPVDFYNQTDSTGILLGTATSDENGEALYIIEEGTPLYLDGEKGYTFAATFEGNENFRKDSKDVSIREAHIEINFEEIDSTRTISAEAYAIDPAGSGKVLLDDIDLSFYVRGSFSLYKIGDEVLHNGKCAIDFPVTLPGDSLGNLTIIAKIEEDDNYGNVEASAIKDWGIVRLPMVPEKSRGLGDTDAPLWMVYTLIVLLGAVWIHYLYVFVVIYMIKKDNKTTA